METDVYWLLTLWIQRQKEFMDTFGQHLILYGIEFKNL